MKLQFVLKRSNVALKDFRLSQESYNIHILIVYSLSIRAIPADGANYQLSVNNWRPKSSLSEAKLGVSPHCYHGKPWTLMSSGRPQTLNIPPLQPHTASTPTTLLPPRVYDLHAPTTEAKVDEMLLFVSGISSTTSP